MRDVSMIFLEAPALDWLGVSDMAAWLGTNERTVRRLTGRLLPRPGKRAGQKTPGWTKLQAAISKWRYEHDELFLPIEAADDSEKTV